MAKKYPLNLIRKDYSYTMQQIADLYGIHEATVQRWVRESGLVHLQGTRPYLVHSSELRSFLSKLQGERKHRCKATELYCMRCQQPQHPKQGSIKASPCKNGSMKIKGKCATCDATMNRNIKAGEWGKKHPLAQYIGGAPKPHKGVEPLPRECQLQGVLDL